MRKSALAIALAALVSASPGVGQIDTTSSNGGALSPFGAPDTATYGQTFVVDPAATTLSSFSLYLRDRRAGSGTLDLRGYVATWDGTKAGALLYTSPTVTMNADGTLQEFAFDTGNLAVTPGDTLVAFLSISDLAAQPESTFFMPLAGNVIPGEFVFINNGTDFNSLFSSSWITGFNAPVDGDAWFRASFAALGVPEPGTWAMMLLGFGAIGMSARRARYRLGRASWTRKIDA